MRSIIRAVADDAAATEVQRTPDQKAQHSLREAAMRFFLR
jgi:hypothetical protein